MKSQSPAWSRCAVPVEALPRRHRRGAYLPIRVGALAVVCTAFAFGLFFDLIERIGPTRTQTVTCLIPAFGMLWGALFLRERITGGMLAGFLCIVASMGLIGGAWGRRLGRGGSPAVLRPYASAMSNPERPVRRAGRRSRRERDVHRDQEERMSSIATPAAASYRIHRPLSTRLVRLGRATSGFVALFCLVDGGARLVAFQPYVDGLAQAGYPASTGTSIALALLCATLLYVVPRTAVLGAIVLTGYLGGAVATQVRLLDPWFWFPAVFAALAWGGLWLREPRLRALLPLRD